MITKKPKIAVLVDFENVNSISKIEKIFLKLEQLGYLAQPRKLITSKINGDKKISDFLNRNLDAELILSSKPIHDKKEENSNNADFRVYVEAMKTYYTDHPDGFCIVSSDEGYTELLHFLKRENQYLIGFISLNGKKNKSYDFISLFNEYYDIAELEEKKTKNSNPVITIEKDMVSGPTLVLKPQVQKAKKDNKTKAIPAPKAKPIQKQKAVKENKVIKSKPTLIEDFMTFTKNYKSDTSEVLMSKLIPEFTKQYTAYSKTKAISKKLVKAGFKIETKKDANGKSKVGTEFINIESIK